MAWDESIYNKWYIEIAPEENPPPQLGCGLELVLEFGGFSLGAIALEP